MVCIRDAQRAVGPASSASRVTDGRTKECHEAAVEVLVHRESNRRNPSAGSLGGFRGERLAGRLIQHDRQ